MGRWFCGICNEVECYVDGPCCGLCNSTCNDTHFVREDCFEKFQVDCDRCGEGGCTDCVEECPCVQACGLSLCEKCREELQKEVEERTAQHEKELESKNDEKKDGDVERGSRDGGGIIDLTEEADEEADDDEDDDDDDDDDEEEDEDEDDFEEGILFPSCGHVGCEGRCQRTYCSDCTKANTKRAKDAYIKEQTEFVENDVNVLNRIRSEIKTDSLQKLLDEWLRVGKDVIQESNKKRKTTNTYMISSRCS